jgi:hypothetical protein
MEQQQNVKIPEDVVDEEQHILTFFVAEVLTEKNIS